MSQLLTPRELRVRLVRWHLNLPDNMLAIDVFEYCAKQLGIPAAHDAARVDAQDETCDALNIDPPYFEHFFDAASKREKTELEG